VYLLRSKEIQVKNRKANLKQNDQDSSWYDKRFCFLTSFHKIKIILSHPLVKLVRVLEGEEVTKLSKIFFFSEKLFV